MSQAYRCDLCGECSDNPDELKAERKVASESATIEGTTADVYIKVGVGVAHVCDYCFATVMQKAKAWVVANVT